MLNLCVFCHSLFIVVVILYVYLMVKVHRDRGKAEGFDFQMGYQQVLTVGRQTTLTIAILKAEVREAQGDGCHGSGVPRVSSQRVRASYHLGLFHLVDQEVGRIKIN